MKNTIRQFKHASSQGFTLIEVLITMLVLSVGILAISHYSGKAMIEIIDNNARATALDVASTSIEPIYIAASNGGPAFKTALDTFNGGITIQGNDAKDSYLVEIIEATDRSGNPVPAVPNADGSPFTIAVRVTYSGLDTNPAAGANSGQQTATASYTYIVN